MLAASLVIAGALAAAHVAFLIAGSPAAWDTVADTWAYNGALVMCGVTCLIRASLSRRMRGAWVAFGIGFLLGPAIVGLVASATTLSASLACVAAAALALAALGTAARA